MARLRSIKGKNWWLVIGKFSHPTEMLKNIHKVSSGNNLKLPQKVARKLFSDPKAIKQILLLKLFPKCKSAVFAWQEVKEENMNCQLPVLTSNSYYTQHLFFLFQSVGIVL